MFNIMLSANIKAKRNNMQQFHKATLAGICISLGCIGLAFIRSDSPLSWALQGVLGGMIFSFGLFAIFVLGLELFTGNCLLIAAYFNGGIKLSDLIRVLWCTLIGNLYGCLLVEMIFSVSGFSYIDVLRTMADAKLDIPWLYLCVRGILCNIVICLATMMNMTENGIVPKFFAAFIPVVLFVACGFEHSIADAFILLFSSSWDILAVIGCFFTVLTGNIIGGVIVSIAHYSSTYVDPYITR